MRNVRCASLVGGLAGCLASVLTAATSASAQINSVTARRDASSGTIIVSGKTSLPPGTRIRVSVSTSPDVVYARTGGHGDFTAPDIGVSRPVVDTSMTARVEIADGAPHLESTFPITVAAISERALARRLEEWTRDSVAIMGRHVLAAFKEGVLTRPDGRKALVPIGAAIHWHEWTNTFKAESWSMQQPSASEWIVALAGRAPKNLHVTARWSYNTDTHVITALDTIAANLAFRDIPTLTCAVEAEAALATFPDSGLAKPAIITRLVILPLPTPPSDKQYKLTADFVVDASGKPELIDWTPPNDADYGKKVLKTLQGWQFRPGFDHEGMRRCTRITTRASIGPWPG